MAKKIKVLVKASGCAWKGVSLAENAVHEIETEDGLLPPLWQNKAVIMDDKTKKVKKDG